MSAAENQVTERDIALWRDETPLVAAGRIHLNNAGAAAMPRSVVARIERHLRLESKLGGYEAADAVAEEVEAAYREIGGVIAAPARNVALVENATAAYAQAMSAFDWAPGDAIVTTRNDYVSNQLHFLALAKRRGVVVHHAEDRPEGGVDPEALADLVASARPKLVSLSLIPTNSGLVQDGEAVGEACRAAGVPYLVDGCQAVGQIPVDVGALGCDFFCATARKFLRGPRGMGFLYVSDAMLESGREPLAIDLRGAEWTGPADYRPVASARRFENWELPYALVLGLGEAARYARAAGIERTAARAAGLAAFARACLAARPWARVLDRGARLAAIVSVEVRGVDAAGLQHELRRRGVHLGATDRASALLDMDAKGAAGATRISPHYFNTEAEIEAAIAAIDEVVS
ncbi:MAG TPA: aminotransferase class V-fold PLP-dependent enzyme [Thermoanaerobaculia bacterium]|nr:aminotransferase class V-fold PLP-dependent enzyme [Thermoanaerobaculia bacterium]